MIDHDLSSAPTASTWKLEPAKPTRTQPTASQTSTSKYCSPLVRQQGLGAATGTQSLQFIQKIKVMQEGSDELDDQAVHPVIFNTCEMRLQNKAHIKSDNYDYDKILYSLFHYTTRMIYCL
jgi:hypothetical protein